MKDGKLKNRLDGLKNAVEPSKAYFVAGGIVAAHSVGLPDVELVRVACDSLSHMASFFPFHDAALGVRSFYEGALTYTASAGIGLADWIAESGEMVSRHMRETVCEMKDWAGDRGETLRGWFHDSLSKSSDFLANMKDRADNVVQDKGPMAWKAFEAIGAAFGSYQALNLARKYALDKLKKLPFWKSGPEDEGAGDAAPSSVIQTLNINIAIGGEPVAREAEKQVREATASRQHPFDPIEAEPNSGDTAPKGKRGVDLSAEVAEALAEKGISRSDILWISDRLSAETKAAFGKTGRDPDTLPPENSREMKIDGGLIFRSKPKHAREDPWAHMSAPETPEHSDDGPWQH